MQGGGCVQHSDRQYNGAKHDGDRLQETQNAVNAQVKVSKESN
jgi:hypothetical protein